MLDELEGLRNRVNQLESKTSYSAFDKVYVVVEDGERLIKDAGYFQNVHSAQNWINHKIEELRSEFAAQGGYMYDWVEPEYEAVELR